MKNVDIGVGNRLGLVKSRITITRVFRSQKIEVHLRGSFLSLMCNFIDFGIKVNSQA